MKNIYILAMAATLMAGCAAPNCIVTTAQSVLGISVAENPATQLYEARAGVVLNQIAVVPCSTNGTGTLIVPDVIQEFRVQNLFAGGMVYQRLAVGANAVNQPGASVMFAKDGSGTLGTNSIETVVNQLNTLKPEK